MSNKKNIGAYFEIPVKDMSRAIAFYSRLFACEFVKTEIHGNEMAFFPSLNGAPGITGALARGEIYQPSESGTLIYLSTEDIDKSLSLVQEMSGAILFEKTEVADYGYVAEFRDCEGNRIALFQGI
jgi:predicted enzyme related to lactoylglutathione lyase